ncbi:MAG TPA: replication-relaxation family protein [Candidatus Acidoferrum sp.]|nr:replication-relaxation family protein [Candidatus Acidoferrum sp.]
MIRLRSPRFGRSPQIRRIQITARDREIVALVARHRFLRSTHITALLGTLSQQISRRLQLLYHHGYLERPRAQLEYFYRGGSSHMVYGLGTKGAALLRDAASDSCGESNWSAKNRVVGRIFLQHALLVSDVLVAAELACRERDGVRFIPQHELFAESIRWHVKTNGERKRSVIPDAAFALERTAPDGSTERANFFLEADRGTTPITRTNPAQSSFRRKFLAYEATWAQGIHQRQFGLHRFRVLTVGTSAARLKALRAECSKLQSGKGLFFFLHKDALANPASLLDAVWTSPQSLQPVSLL